jgi:hypothetical protein
MFRPCKRAIVRLYLEPVVDIQWEWGGYEISSYKIHVGVKYLFSYSVRVLLIKFLIAVPSVLAHTRTTQHPCHNTRQDQRERREQQLGM